MFNVSQNGRKIKQRIGRDCRTAELALKEVEVKLARNQIGLVEQRVGLNDFCKEFMGYVLTNKARNTVQGYRATLDHFLRFLDKTRVQYLENVTEKHLEGFKTFRCTMNVSPGTINQELPICPATMDRYRHCRSPVVSSPGMVSRLSDLIIRTGFIPYLSSRYMLAATANNVQIS